MKLTSAPIALLAAGLAYFPLTAVPHHSFAPNYDINGDMEITGEVVALRWRNPHIEFDVRVADDSGETVWTVESQSLPGLRARDVTEPFIAVGDNVTLAGNPGRRGRTRVFLSNLLLPNNEELILRDDIEPRFGQRLVDTRGSWNATEGDGSAPELGIFRVWTTTEASPFPFPEDGDPALAHTDFPLTPQARAVLEAFDAVADSPIRDCRTKGMPTIMEQPYPMEMLEDEDGNILMHMEEYDLVRTFYMNPETAPEPVPNILGYSVGRWEGNTLIVNTSHLSWEWFNTVGIRLSHDATTVEEFTLHEDGSRLDWKMTVTDPTTFTEPVDREKYFLYVPGVEVREFACTAGD